MVLHLGSNAIGRLAIGQISTNISLTLGATTGTFTETGLAALFRVSAVMAAGAFVETGIAAAFKTSFVAAPTSYIITGFPANVIIMEAEGAGTYIVTGNAAHFSRDFVNWLPSGKPNSAWGAAGIPSSTWTPAATPSNTWTKDPAQAIPGPVVP